MKEINIAKVLVSKRREKGVTQDELAQYIGVSKASVSKWETGQSYPDVTFLPMLASYFNISIDELIDYKPQMEKDDIRRLYRRLSSDFASKPFETVLEEIRRTAAKYYACFPLLLQMGLLILNHIELAPAGGTAALLTEAEALFVRVREESSDVPLVRKALYLQALCELGAGRPKETLALLDGSLEDPLPPESLMASAYGQTGRPRDAKAVLQAGMYKELVILFNFLPAYLTLCADEPAKFEETLRRAEGVGELFDMRHLHPSVFVGVYLAAAMGYLAQDNAPRALDMLEAYTSLVTDDIFPLRLHGDGFFDLLDGWLDDLELGHSLPRDDKTIRRSMTDVIIKNPAFAALSDDTRFKSISTRLRDGEGKEDHHHDI